MGIKELRAMTGLSQQEFANTYHIPKRTIENWESTGTAHRDPPKYLLELIEYKIKTENERRNNMEENEKKIFSEYGELEYLEVEDFWAGAWNILGQDTDEDGERWDIVENETGRRYTSI